MSLSVRRMRADELEACAALYGRAVRDTFTWLDVGDPEEAFRLATREEQVFVAVEEGRILGLAALYWPEDFLHSLYVEPGLTGRGLGLALLRHVDEAAQGPVTLKVQVLNFRARRFYAREGFLEVEAGGEPWPSNDRWLKLGRWAEPGSPSPAPVLQIRPATGEDLDLCAALYERVAARSFVWEPPEARTAASKAASFEGETVLAAFEHGVLAGFTAFNPAAGTLSSLFVEPQGAGTGPALLAAAAARMPGGYVLECDDRNLAGLRFYGRLGFTPAGETVTPHYRLIQLQSPG